MAKQRIFGIRKDALDVLSSGSFGAIRWWMRVYSLWSILFGFKFLGPGFTNSQPRGGDYLVINPL